MTLDEYNAFCAGLPASFHVVQWGGADVWKVGVGAKSKVFAIAWGDAEGGAPSVTFKTSEIAFEALRDHPGLRPAPYLASRGLSWIQHYEPPGLDDAALCEHLRQSHRLASLNLPKKLRAELGLVDL